VVLLMCVLGHVLPPQLVQQQQQFFKAYMGAASCMQ
jgi:hypothetical protein